MNTPRETRGGTYALILSLARDETIAVGKLGTFTFPRGYYIYTGSGLNGLAARIRHHLRGPEKLRWHVDYLRRKARPVEVWCIESPERLECDWYLAIAGMPGAKTPVNGFGSSDCRCCSHLAYLEQPPSFEDFHLSLEKHGRGLKKMKPERFLASPVSSHVGLLSEEGPVTG